MALINQINEKRDDLFPDTRIHGYTDTRGEKTCLR